MAGLVIFTEVAIAGCAFLIYFMYALWRDSRSSRQAPKVEIRKLSRRNDNYRLLRLYSPEDLCGREKKRV
jgi:threonine/homoserine/homoserine lactone efflux protein